MIRAREHRLPLAAAFVVCSAATGAQAQPQPQAGAVESELAAAAYPSHDARLLRLLLQLLDTGRPEARRRAAEELALTEDPRAAMPLQFALGHDELLVRIAAAKALGSYPSTGAQDALYLVLRSEQEPAELRIAAAQALGAQHLPRAAWPKNPRRSTAAAERS